MMCICSDLHFVFIDPEAGPLRERKQPCNACFLKRLLEDRRAEVAIRIDTREELRDITALFFSKDVPVVIRGGGSGNYGQLIPLYGGAVLDISGMSKIFSVDGVVRAEAGATLRAIEFEARKAGWELRCMPSTWAISSIGGFFCGGSGGIGLLQGSPGSGPGEHPERLGGRTGGAAPGAGERCLA